VNDLVGKHLIVPDNQTGERFGREAFDSLPKPTKQKNNGDRHPRGIVRISGRNNNPLHPTQKPVELCEYFVKTYSNENDVVLDFTMGSGSVGVACGNLNRKFIGIERDEDYFNIAKDRISEAYKGV